MDEAWQLVWSNYSLSAFHAAVPSWQLMFRCVVFVLQGFYRNTVLTMVQACFLLIMVWPISWNLNVSHGC